MLEFLVILKWPNFQVNSQQNDEIPKKIPTICDTLLPYTSPSSFLFPFSFLLLLPPQKEEEGVYMGAQKAQKSQPFGVPKWWMVMVMMMPDAA